MIQKQTFRRAVLIGLFALLAVSATTLLISPETQAVACEDNKHSNVVTEWIVTPAAQERTDSGDYCDSLRPICREECLVGCGETVPQGYFGCFAN